MFPDSVITCFLREGSEGERQVRQEGTSVMWHWYKIYSGRLLCLHKPPSPFSWGRKTHQAVAHTNQCCKSHIPLKPWPHLWQHMWLLGDNYGVIERGLLWFQVGKQLEQRIKVRTKRKGHSKFKAGTEFIPKWQFFSVWSFPWRDREHILKLKLLPRRANWGLQFSG